jgi:hypothetical protein
MMLRRDGLGIDQIHLLRRYCFFAGLGRFPRSWSFPANIIKRVFVICLEFGMFELPCLHQSVSPRVHVRTVRTWPIGRLSVLLVVVPYFVEIVFVELSNEAGKIAMLEMLRKYRFREFLVLFIV